MTRDRRLQHTLVWCLDDCMPNAGTVLSLELVWSTAMIGERHNMSFVIVPAVQLASTSRSSATEDQTSGNI